jgi:drug/metabolite transporter (DMT)-like permease
MAGSRYFVAGLIIYAWMRLRKDIPKPSRSQWIGAAIVGALMLLGGNGTLVWAEQRVPSGIAALLIATVPFWMVLLDWLWLHNRRPTRRVMAGIVLGFAGIALLIGQGKITGGHALDAIGTGVLLLAALSWATGSLYSRGASLHSSPFMATAMQMVSGGSLMLLAGLAGGEWGRLDFDAITWLSVASWGFLLVFGSMIGFTCYIWLLRVAPADKVATYAYVNPVVAVFLGWLFAGEVLTLQTFLATGVIITAVVLINTRSRKPALKLEENFPENGKDQIVAPIPEAKKCA